MKDNRRLRIATGLFAACLLAAGSAHAQGVTKTTILIGQSGPLSGANKEFGEDIRDGALAYFSAVNAAGGINGRKLELITIDDANDAQRSGENGRVLIEEKGVLAVFGYASATLSIPALPHVEKHRVPFVAPFTGAEPMRKFHPYVYNMRASYADELEKIVDFYASTGIKRFSVLHYDDAVGKENLGAVETALDQLGEAQPARTRRRGFRNDQIAPRRGHHDDAVSNHRRLRQAGQERRLGRPVRQHLVCRRKRPRRRARPAGRGNARRAGRSARLPVVYYREGISGRDREATRQEGLFIHLARIVHRREGAGGRHPPRRRQPDPRKPAEGA